MKIKTLVLLSLVATLIMMAVMQWQGAPLKVHEVSPHGIVSLEFARTVAGAAAIYRAWNPTLINVAETNTYIDFIFILAYGAFLFFASLMLLKKDGILWRRLNQWICVAALAAPTFDVIENVLMLRTLSNHISKEVVASTFMFALLKFYLAAVTVVFIIVKSIAIIKKSREKKISVV